MCGALSSSTSRSLKGLADQAEFVILEIAQTAMDELGAGGRSSAGKVLLLDHHDLEAATRRIARNAMPLTPPDHEKIEAVSSACHAYPSLAVVLGKEKVKLPNSSRRP